MRRLQNLDSIILEHIWQFLADGDLIEIFSLTETLNLAATALAVFERRGAIEAARRQLRPRVLAERPF